MPGAARFACSPAAGASVRNRRHGCYVAGKEISLARPCRKREESALRENDGGVVGGGGGTNVAAGGCAELQRRAMRPNFLARNYTAHAACRMPLFQIRIKDIMVSNLLIRLSPIQMTRSTKARSRALSTSDLRTWRSRLHFPQMQP